MSAISLKSITGITSITTPAGVDNQLTLHTNNTTERVKIDVAGNVHVNNQLSVAGGFFILHKDKYDWWKNTYYKTLTKYFTYDYLIKDDQIILLDCIISNLKQFKIIQETNHHHDPWFVFQNYLL